MKHFLEHRGYFGEVYYSEEDECYVGMVLGIRGMIGVHEYTASDTIRELIEAIDEYLEDCAAEGCKPNTTDPKVAIEMEALLGKKSEDDFHVVENRKSLAFAH